MRLWTLHPKYLDAQGLVALWRKVSSRALCSGARPRVIAIIRSCSGFAPSPHREPQSIFIFERSRMRQSIAAMHSIGAK